MNSKKNTLKGEWSQGTAWTLNHCTTFTNSASVTASKVLCIHNGRIALTKNHRGWELPGGHIEKGESVESATRREMLEETGVVIGELQLIGVMKITNKVAIVNKATGVYYPNPSFLLFYSGEFQEQLNISANDETLDTAWFDGKAPELESTSEKDIISFFLESNAQAKQEALPHASCFA